MNGPAATTFLDEVWALVPQGRRTALERSAAAIARTGRTDPPRVHYHDGIVTAERDLRVGTVRAQISASTSSRMVVVAENVNLEWITELGTELGIPAAPFAHHVCNPEGTDPWSAVFVPYLERQPVSTVRPTGHNGHFWSVDGVYSFEPTGTAPVEGVGMSSTNISRTTALASDYGVQSSTRMTCWSGKCLEKDGKAKHLYLFLVDSQPFTIQNLNTSLPPAAFVRLQIPVSGNRGGLTLPSLFNSTLPSLFADLNAFLSHEWHFRALFPSLRLPIASSSLLYLFAASTLQSNARYLDRQIKKIAYEDIRRPSLETNDQLHDCRRLLMNVREQAEMAKVWMPNAVTLDIETIHKSFPEPRPYLRQPSATLADLVTSLNELERFLMDSFNLLMSSISVQQNDKSQRLTILAFIYIPLSFVTGVFGMNIADINGSTPPWWSVLVALVITLIVTAAVFWSSIVSSKHAAHHGRHVQAQRQ